MHTGNGTRLSYLVSLSMTGVTEDALLEYCE